jgi:uncharacterized protein (TIGR00645 family)
VKKLSYVEKFLEIVIFNSRWIQVPVFLGLIAVQLLYSYRFVLDVIHIYQINKTVNEVVFMHLVLGLVDIVMVVNLINMVIIGGWATFVSKLDLDNHPDRPSWLGHIDPGTLKTKLAGALIGISGIHLMQTFTGISDPSVDLDNSKIMWQVFIHLTFVISTVVLAWSDLLVQKKVHIDNCDRWE